MGYRYQHVYLYVRVSSICKHSLLEHIHTHTHTHMHTRTHAHTYARAHGWLYHLYECIF